MLWLEHRMQSGRELLLVQCAQRAMHERLAPLH